MKSWDELAKQGAQTAGEQEIDFDGMLDEDVPAEELKLDPPKPKAKPKETVSEMVARIQAEQATNPAFVSEREHRDRKAFVERQRIKRAHEEEKFREAELESLAKASKEAFDDIFSTYTDHLKSRYKREVDQHTRAVATAVPFIDPVFDDYFKLTPGQLVTVAAYSGEGKSTNAANITASAVLAEKRAIILSNEERSTDFMDMVACICEGLYHKEFVDRTMAPADQKKVMRRVGTLLRDKRFISLDEADTNGGTTKDDYILNTLQFLAEASVKPDVVVIDYLTNIYAVGSTTSDNHYFQLDRFLSRLKNLINKLPFPLVVCAQMHSQDKKKGQSGKPAALDTRLIMGGAIFRCSTIVLEVKPDFETKVSTITIHKNRTYKEKGEVSLKFDKGRLKLLDPMEALQLQNDTEPSE